MSFRLKTILGIALIEAALLAFLIFNVINYLRDSNEQQLLDRVTTTVELFATATKDAVIAYDLATLESLINALLTNPGLEYARILDADGRILAQQGDKDILQRTFRPNYSSEDVTDGIYDIQARILEADYVYGTVQLGFDIKNLQTTLEEAKRNSIFIALFEMILVALFSTFLGIYLTSQLKRLTIASEKVASGKLGYQLDVKGDDEIASTIKAFNTMSLEIKEFVDRIEQTKAEMQQAKIEAEKANEAKSLFLSNMSHELRTPLNAVIGFSDILLLEANQPDQQDALEEINNAGKHLLSLINEILDMSKIEAGSFHVNKEPVDLDNIIDESIRLVTPILAKKNISLNLHAKNTALQVSGDSIRMKQTILNLLSNAIKYNKPDGRVDIYVDKINPKYCELSIKDSGIGIPSDKLDYLFKPFNRLNERDYANEGTGIGLSITKSLIELMEGEIKVSSAEGEGSTFKVKMLLWPTSEIPSYAIADNQSSNTGHTPSQADDEQENKGLAIVYVEDDKANQRLMTKMMEKWPEYHLYIADNGEQCITLCEKIQPDIMLMDINLPGLNGVDTMLKLKQLDSRFDQIPFIAVTANAMQADIQHFEAAGFSSVITKPLDIDKFLILLQQFTRV